MTSDDKLSLRFVMCAVAVPITFLISSSATCTQGNGQKKDARRHKVEQLEQQMRTIWPDDERGSERGRSRQRTNGRSRKEPTNGFGQQADRRTGRANEPATL